MKGSARLTACVLTGVLAAVGTAAARDSHRSTLRGVRTTAATSSCKRASIGIMAPLTGPKSLVVLGTEQLHWAQLFVDRWNKASGHKPKIDLVWGDTRVGALAAAKKLAGNRAVVATIGPATASEVQASAGIFRGAGMAMVSPSAQQTSLTGGKLRGFFFRVVPSAAAEGPTDAAFMLSKLGVKKGDAVMVVDDGQGLNTNLAASVSKRLQAAGVEVDRESVATNQTDFSSLVAKVDARTEIVFLGLGASAAQQFGLQLRKARKSTTLFAGQEALAPSTFTISDSYVSFFVPFPWSLPTNTSIVNAFVAAYGPPGPFGHPAYVAAQVLVGAIKASCAREHGTVSRTLVRKYLPKAHLKGSVLGAPISFAPNGDLENGKFSIYKIAGGGYVLQR